MRKVASLMTFVLVAMVLALPAAAEEPKAQEVKAGAAMAAAAEAEAANSITLTGYITDEWCGKKNANADAKSADCARDCAQKGAALVMFKDGTMYTLADKEAALKHVGEKVMVTGTVDDKNVVTIVKIEKVDEKKT